MAYWAYGAQYGYANERGWVWFTNHWRMETETHYPTSDIPLEVQVAWDTFCKEQRKEHPNFRVVKRPFVDDLYCALKEAYDAGWKSGPSTNLADQEAKILKPNDKTLK